MVFFAVSAMFSASVMAVASFWLMRLWLEPLVVVLPVAAAGVAAPVDGLVLAGVLSGMVFYGLVVVFGRGEKMGCALQRGGAEIGQNLSIPGKSLSVPEAFLSGKMGVLSVPARFLSGIAMRRSDFLESVATPPAGGMDSGEKRPVAS